MCVGMWTALSGVSSIYVAFGADPERHSTVSAVAPVDLPKEMAEHRPENLRRPGAPQSSHRTIRLDQLLSFRLT